MDDLGSIVVWFVNDTSASDTHQILTDVCVFQCHSSSEVIDMTWDANRSILFVLESSGQRFSGLALCHLIKFDSRNSMLLCPCQYQRHRPTNFFISCSTGGSCPSGRIFLVSKRITTGLCHVEHQYNQIGIGTLNPVDSFAGVNISVLLAVTTPSLEIGWDLRTRASFN
jgi:hypothetical protein